MSQPAAAASHSPPQTFIIGLSGPSSSGKTTLARLLRQIFNTSSSSRSRADRSIRLFILHEDDFYKTDDLIPVQTVTSLDHGTRDVSDWDCAESLDISLLTSTLQHIKQHGSLPPDMFSKEDQNTVGESGVPDDMVGRYKVDVTEWFGSLNNTRTTASRSPTAGADVGEGGDEGTADVVICLFDGFILYPDPASKEGSLERELRDSLGGILDAKLFISGTRALTIERRAKRTGYVTLEGFWADPPGYVADLVWPNYRRDHGWLYRRAGESEEQTTEAVDSGRVNRTVAAEQGILVAPGDGEAQLKEILPWAVQRVKDVVGKKENTQ